MAQTSEVKSGLDAIGEIITGQRAVIEKAQSNAQIASDALAAILVDYADVIATIDAYTGADAFETLSKDEKARLANEFTALKALADAIVAVV